MGMDISADRLRLDGVSLKGCGRWLAMAVLLATVGCSSNTSPGPTMPLPSSPHPSAIGIYPPLPAGATDCGINNEMSGWPTTTTPGPSTYSCIYDALSSRRPARFVVIRPSNVDSGRRTSDGYSIPAGIVVTYRVLGPAQLEVTNDGRSAGGPITTRICTGMAEPLPWQPPNLRGCSG